MGYCYMMNNKEESYKLTTLYEGSVFCNPDGTIIVLDRPVNRYEIIYIDVYGGLGCGYTGTSGTDRQVSLQVSYALSGTLAKTKKEYDTGSSQTETVSSHVAFDSPTSNNNELKFYTSKVWSHDYPSEEFNGYITITGRLK